MNFAGSFEHIGTVDIGELADLVAGISDEQWSSFSLRQQRYEVHRDTESVGLVYDPDFRHTHPTKLPMLQTFQAALKPVLTMIAGRYENTEHGQALIKQNGLGYFIRATLVKLLPGGTIPAHQDLNFSLTHSHRVHVPIVTNPDVLFTVGEETLHLPPGEVYEINNRRMHSVENEGDEARVHLILDFVLPGEQCCCGRKLHPDTRCSPQACMDTVRLKVPCNCYPEA